MLEKFRATKLDLPTNLGAPEVARKKLEEDNSALQARKSAAEKQSLGDFKEILRTSRRNQGGARHRSSADRGAREGGTERQDICHRGLGSCDEAVGS